MLEKDTGTVERTHRNFGTGMCGDGAMFCRKKILVLKVDHIRK